VQPRHQRCQFTLEQPVQQWLPGVERALLPQPRERVAQKPTRRPVEVHMARKRLDQFRHLKPVLALRSPQQFGSEQQDVGVPTASGAEAVNLSGPNGQQRSSATLDAIEVHHGSAFSASDVHEHVKVVAVVTLQVGSGHPSSQVRHREDLEIQRALGRGPISDLLDIDGSRSARHRIHCPIFTIRQPTLIVSNTAAT
jgi:hypothetical protein